MLATSPRLSLICAETLPVRGGPGERRRPPNAVVRRLDWGFSGVPEYVSLGKPARGGGIPTYIPPELLSKRRYNSVLLVSRPAEDTYIQVQQEKLYGRIVFRVAVKVR